MPDGLWRANFANGSGFATYEQKSAALRAAADPNVAPLMLSGQPPEPACTDPRPERPATIKRATLFDGVIDTFRTETELNGWKPRQGVLL